MKTIKLFSRLFAVFGLLMIFAVSGWSAPTYQAVGTLASGSTGSITPAWPAHQSGDVALLIVETDNAAVTLTSNAAGFVEVTNSPQSTQGRDSQYFGRERPPAVWQIRLLEFPVTIR